MQKPLEPYRLFFPLGVFLGIWATAVWIVFASGLAATYPGAFHANLMIGGFLFAFVYGFFLTAIPRFTATPPASAAEQGGALGIFAATISAAFLGDGALFHWLSVLGILFLVGFGARRISKASQPLPASFMFVGIGLACGLLGQGVFLAMAGGVLSSEWYLTAKSLYYHDMMLALVLGVGGQLVPAILGHRSLPGEESSPRRHDAGKNGYGTATGMALLFVVAVGLEALGKSWLSDMVKFAVVVLVGVKFWKIHKIPSIKGPLQLWMWAAAWFVVIGSLALVILPLARMHSLHIIFVGGFGLMALMVASQVTILHSERLAPLQFRKSKALWLIGGAIVFAAIIRVSAPMAGDGYVNHLGYAAGTWILSLILWAGVFVRYMVPARIKDR